MTPKEKAEELVYKFINLNSHKMSDYSRIEYPTAKQCALIVVDELIIEKNKWENGSFHTSKYWDYVKEEINKV